MMIAWSMPVGSKPSYNWRMQKPGAGVTVY